MKFETRIYKSMTLSRENLGVNGENTAGNENYRLYMQN